MLRSILHTHKKEKKSVAAYGFRQHDSEKKTTVPPKWLSFW